MLSIHNNGVYWKATLYSPPTNDFGFGAAPIKVEGHEATYDGRYVRLWLRQYREFEKLPRLTKEAVSVLSMCDNNEKLPGIGRRVNEKLFWLEDNEAMIKEYEDGDQAPTDEL